MPSTDPRIDAYIESAADFAQPILRHLRALIHEVCPEVQETVRWSFPHFDYEGILCSIASFKAHCTLNFQNPELVVGEDAVSGGMGQFGRITSLDELPSDQKLRAYLEKGMELNRAGVKPERKRRKTKRAEPEVPPDLAEALEQHPGALATFQGFSPSHRRDYVEWITEAKRDATRRRRIDQAVAWMAEGKPRNWKYMG